MPKALSWLALFSPMPLTSVKACSIEGSLAYMEGTVLAGGSGIAGCTVATGSWITGVSVAGGV
jgi:hypothetical protein